MKKAVRISIWKWPGLWRHRDFVSDAAMHGLILAALRFDARRGDWEIYRNWRIHGGIKEAIRDLARHRRMREERDRRILAAERIRPEHDPEWLVDALREAVTALPPRPRRVIEQYYLEGRKLKDIAAEDGVSDGRISQIKREGLELLREALKGGRPKDP